MSNFYIITECNNHNGCDNTDYCIQRRCERGSFMLKDYYYNIKSVLISSRLLFIKNLFHRLQVVQRWAIGAMVAQEVLARKATCVEIVVSA